MNYWIFKVSDRGKYPDTSGEKYVYDNTHSVKVKAGDEFIYLEKKRTQYRLTGAGLISRVTRRKAKSIERHSTRVEFVFTAHLKDVVWFAAPFCLSPQTKAGRKNRRTVGLPRDLNSIGWSISMPRIGRELFAQLLDAALEASQLNAPQSGGGSGRDEGDWRVEDSWSLTRRRACMQVFRQIVLKRHNYTCVVCGTRLQSVIQTAHVRSYASDPDNRANPANGLCLCSYCHTAYDSGDISINPNGVVQFDAGLIDEIALEHFTSVSADRRRRWLRGVNTSFLLERCEATE